MTGVTNKLSKHFVRMPRLNKTRKHSRSRSPKRTKSRSPKHSPNSPSKKLAKIIAEDPIFKAFAEGTTWGNLILKNDESKPKFWAANEPHKNLNDKAHAIIPNNNAERRSNGNNTNLYELRDILEDYKVPDLRQRKGIWENFPVTLVKLDDKDNVDRYAVSWHNKNLKEWRNTKPQSWEEWMNYQDWVEARLLYSIRHFPNKYKILPPRNPSQLFVIEMVF